MGQLQQVHTDQRPMRTPPIAQLTTAIVEDTLRRIFVYVIASGAPQGQAMKFFFYARQASVVSPLGGYLLLEVSMLPGQMAQCTVKVDSDVQTASIESFFKLFWEALDSFVVR